MPAVPLVISGPEWDRIVRWTGQSKEDQDQVRRREYIKYMDETSKLMCRDWPNSVENINKRNEEARLARAAAVEQANSIFYTNYLKKQEEKQKRLMSSAKDTIFLNKDAPKMLLSAVIETVVQKEREEQVKFLHQRRKEAAEERRRDAEDINTKAKAWNQLQDEKKRRRYLTNKQHQKEIIEQAQEITERNQQEYEDELVLQKLDNLKANEQMDAIKEFQINFKEEEKSRIMSDIQKSRQEYEQRKSERESRDRMDDQLIQVLVNSRARVQKRRKDTEKQMQVERLRVLEAISKRLESGDAARDAAEQQMLDNAVQEKLDLAEEKRLAQIKKEENSRVERQKVWQQFLQEQEAKHHSEMTMKKWSIINRFKNSEINEDFKEKLRQEKEKKTAEYKDIILKQWKERTEREKEELEERRRFYQENGRKLQREDERVRAHAAGLLQEARRLGRPDHALVRAAQSYCRMYRLVPLPELPASLQKHFPHYTPAHLHDAPPGESPDVPQNEEKPRTNKTNGLQELRKSSETKMRAQEVPTSDYRRRGPANGLQTKPGKKHSNLPPLCQEECQLTNKT